MINYVKIVHLALILSFVFVVVMGTNQQVNADKHYPNYNNPDFYYETIDQQTKYNTNPITYINSHLPPNTIIMIQQLLDDSYNNGYQDGLERSTYAPEPTLTINEILGDQSKSIIEQCVNEQGYSVDPSIRIFASVKNDMLKVRGIGIHYDSNFSDQGVISLSPVNDYDGTKDIHLVEVRNNNRFIGLFDVSKVFYNDYVYAGTHHNGNIDSSGNYKIEIQYDDQCGFTYLEYHHSTTESITQDRNNEDVRVVYYDNENINQIYDNGNILIVEYYKSGSFKSYSESYNDEIIKKYSKTGMEETFDNYMQLKNQNEDNLYPDKELDSNGFQDSSLGTISTSQSQVLEPTLVAPTEPEFQRYSYFGNGNVAVEYWDNGNPKTSYNDNGSIGTEYYENGNAKTSYYFENGNISGEYYENGNTQNFYYENGNLGSIYWDNGNPKEYYREDGSLFATYHENGNDKDRYDENENIIKTYQIPEQSISEPIDYSNACIDEHHNFQESTINISASQTWVKETIGSPISGNGIVKSGGSSSAILTILGPDKVGMSYEVPVKSDGTFWKFFETRDMFVDDSLYGNYLISVRYNDQCGETTLDYMRGYPPSTTPTLEEVHESDETSEAVEVVYYKIPLSFSKGNFADAHRSHAEIIEVNAKYSCFNPNKVTIPVGGEVIFVVSDGNGHTIGQGTDKSHPYNGEFRVDNLVSGGQFSHTFNNVGEYLYFTQICPDAEGIIIVK